MSEIGDILKTIENVIDDLYDESLKCPYCGAVQGDDWELEEGDGITECCECEKEFKFNKQYIVKYTSEKIEECEAELGLIEYNDPV